MNGYRLRSLLLDLSEETPDVDLVVSKLSTIIDTSRDCDKPIYENLLTRYVSGTLDSSNLLRLLYLFSLPLSSLNKYSYTSWCKEFLRMLLCDNEEKRHYEIRIKAIINGYNSEGV